MLLKFFLAIIRVFNWGLANDDNACKKYSVQFRQQYNKLKQYDIKSMRTVK